jgi:two-component sensor histidine kinase
MPAYQPKPTISRHGGLPVREGSAPFGHYWGVAIIAALSMVSICLALLVPTGHPLRSVAPITGAVVLAASLVHIARERKWERESHRRRFAAMHWLIELVTPMGTEEGAEAATLRKLPEAILTLLGMKKSCVGLLEDDGKTLHVVAESGIHPTLEGRKFAISDLALTRKCIESKYLVHVVDTQNAKVAVNATLAKELNLITMLQIPMVYNGEVLGVMSIGDDRPRDLTEMDKGRAWVWGCLAAVLLAHSRLYAKMRQALQEKNRLIEHRNAIFDLNNSIQHPGTLAEVLQRIVDLAPVPLAVDSAVIWMPAEDNAEEFAIAAATAPFGTPVVGFRIPMRGSRIQAMMESRQTLVVENGHEDPSLRPELKSRLPHGSLIFEPLFRENKQMLGVLVLARCEAGPFTAEQLDLARLFATRASAALEMAELNHRARADADAKAMLLRELNHRVKNNLARIVSLLSIHQPALPRDAQKWLDRVNERISAMAQAHDLFNAGPQRVTLGELIDRTVQSLSVVKPAGVTVKTDLASVHARLRTERAVSLAMAMHELCFNGIVHGLGETGTLTIRARRDNGHLALEVEDDGEAGRPAKVPIEPTPEPGARVGIGLSLVRGLVGRELHGKFELSPSRGGSVARVQFPLLPDEITGAVL